MLFSSALTLAMQNTVTIVVEQRAGAVSSVDSHALKLLESGVKQLEGHWHASMAQLYFCLSLGHFLEIPCHYHCFLIHLTCAACSTTFQSTWLLVACAPVRAITKMPPRKINQKFESSFRIKRNNQFLDSLLESISVWFSWIRLLVCALVRAITKMPPRKINQKFESSFRIKRNNQCLDSLLKWHWSGMMAVWVLSGAGALTRSRGGAARPILQSDGQDNKLKGGCPRPATLAPKRRLAWAASLLLAVQISAASIQTTSNP